MEQTFYTPILAATVNGVIEMVEKILQEFPMTIHDWDSTRKNIVLVAVESRQSHIYDFLLRRRSDVVDKDLAFHERDEKGNSALHIAAGLQNSRGWFIPTSMLQLQWEVKWFEYVKNTLPPDFCIGTNIYRKTALQIFTETHGQLLDKSKEWLNNTCNSCSFIAALISTVAFASSATVPGGVDQDTGEPIFQHHLAFRFFAISSLVALCSSFISLLFFFAILTSKYDYKDFSYNLPWNIILGLTSLFVSMAAMLVCFCSGHFLMLDDHLKYPAIPVYALTLWAVTYFALQQSSSYFILLRATFKKVPQRMYPQDPL
ncbi:ankyrin repeat-containing protein ITN1 [Vitis vinifera]|uniref:ankyrin repeat-containing protein ITN1 n=1 Tax=Vitis vinifera TaxID=29760 RepID=UPI0008FECCB5|nr:ankyrin repeat-containing protein ITN1 [Vitis vinifera]|eukprot:XP_019073764.1 PREDICTED: ankyrin repeat-containing protein ITN1-like [Vitis vinifera]